VAEHVIAKPEVLINAYVGTLADVLVVPNLFQWEGFARFVGADDDTVNIKVPGVLPYHTYAWRNNRAAELVVDTYSERKIPVSFGGNIYNAATLTDEQRAMDLMGWGPIITSQTRAIADGLERMCVSALNAQAYPVVIGNTALNLRGALIEAKRVLDKLHAPKQGRYLLVGSDYEAALLGDDKLNLAQNVGEAEAQAALTMATIGHRMGFRIVPSVEIPGDAAIAGCESAFVLVTGAPAVPSSVPAGSVGSYDGYAMRWISDYDSTRLQDRSIVNTFAGTRSVTDVLQGWDDVNKTATISAGEHFVRAIKLTLDGSSDYPEPSTELSAFTGLSSASVWTPTGRFAEGNAANA